MLEEEVGAKRRERLLVEGDIGARRRERLLVKGEVGVRRRKRLLVEGEVGARRRKRLLVEGEVGARRERLLVEGEVGNLVRKSRCLQYFIICSFLFILFCAFKMLFVFIYFFALMVHTFTVLLSLIVLTILNICSPDLNLY